MPARRSTATSASADPSKRITQRIRELKDWRGERLAEIRALIHEADPLVVEEWKWAKATNPGVPVWSHAGIVCTGESYQSHLKLTFLKGASLKDAKKLFNAELEGNARRAISIKEGDKLDARAFKALFREAVALNESKTAKR